MPGFSITVNVTQHDEYVKLLKHEVKFAGHNLFHNIIHSLNMLSPKPKFLIVSLLKWVNVYNTLFQNVSVDYKGGRVSHKWVHWARSQLILADTQ